MMMQQFNNFTFLATIQLNQTLNSRKPVHLEQLEFNCLPAFIACTDMIAQKHFVAKTSIVNQDLRNLCKHLPGPQTNSPRK